MTEYRTRRGGLAAVHLVLLLLLAAVVAGVLIKQSFYDRRVFNPEKVLAEAFLDSETPGDSIHFDEAVPPGFVPMGPMERYDEESLYEKINGKAPLYLDSGFVLLRTQRFVSEQAEGKWFELYLYDMGSAANAFAVYSTQKRIDVTPLDITRFAYQTPDAVFAAAGSYYIELIGTAEGDAMLEAKQYVLSALIEKPDLAAAQIPEMKAFVTQNLIPGSISLSVAGAFGFEELTHLFTAQYDIEGEQVTAFLRHFPDAASAASLAGAYRDFLIENGAEPLDIGSERPNWYALDFYGTYEVIFVYDNYMGGVHAATERQTALDLAQLLYENLRQEETP